MNKYNNHNFNFINEYFNIEKNKFDLSKNDEASNETSENEAYNFAMTNTEIIPTIHSNNFPFKQNNTSNISAKEHDFFSFLINFFANSSRFSDFEYFSLAMNKHFDNLIADLDLNIPLLKKIISHKKIYLKKYTREKIVERNNEYKKMNPSKIILIWIFIGILNYLLIKF